MRACHLHHVQLLQPEDYPLSTTWFLQQSATDNAFLPPYCSRMKHTSHMREPSMSIAPMRGLWETLIVRNHVQLNSVFRSMFGTKFLETTSLDQTFCPVLWIHVNIAFGQWWIGHGGSVHWPARPLDLSCLDLFFWGHMKSLAFEAPVPSILHTTRISVASGRIRDIPGIF
ncbi:hypothetical protein TNCV_320981 [Trichonephila clavipes]|nr:hypothetical protein TNCV_320981 [Trichonephila clavipes]